MAFFVWNVYGTYTICFWIDIEDILQCPVTLLSVKGLGRFLPEIINIVDIFAVTMMLRQILAEYLLR